MENENSDLVLSDAEIEALTHCKRTKEQLRELELMKIPAHHRKHDNSICVLRMYVTVPGVAPNPAANDEPQLKSSRK